jgi:hypothetical protein
MGEKSSWRKDSLDPGKERLEVSEKRSEPQREKLREKLVNWVPYGGARSAVDPGGSGQLQKGSDWEKESEGKNSCAQGGSVRGRKELCPGKGKRVGAQVEVAISGPQGERSIWEKKHLGSRKGQLVDSSGKAVGRVSEGGERN